MSKKKFFVTTPIYYVNDRPHIGHLCTTLAADVLARYHRLLGEDVFFLTGTDEHGAKIAEAARKEGKEPEEFCDELAGEFKENWDKLNLSYDFFIRTTDPRHEKIVSEFIQKLYDKDYIYKDKYEGLYCIGCEKFLTDSDLVDGKCPYHPTKEPVKQSEENYFFKLSKFERDIKKAIKGERGDENHYKIVPPNKEHEILSKLELGLKNISISRAEVSWGIPIPWDKKQTIYVWFDALLNYYTATQFLKDKKKFWPADLHIVGKEISWFHNVIWQAMLLAADFPLPKKVLVHSFYISGGQKMSKSIGNIISPEKLISRFGIDGTRYLILSTFPYPKDSDITMDYLMEKYNADLANGLGNLVQRVGKLAEKIGLGNLEVKDVNNLETGVSIELFRFSQALELIQENISILDKYIEKERPWEQTDGKLKNTLLKIIVGDKNSKSILDIAFALKPFLPETSEKIEKIFTADKIIAPKKPLFPRV